jgi:hypothetical protein
MQTVLRVISNFSRKHVIVIARHEYGDDSQQGLGVALQSVGDVVIDPETRIDADRQARGNERIDRPKPFRFRIGFHIFASQWTGYPQCKPTWRVRVRYSWLLRNRGTGAAPAKAWCSQRSKTPSQPSTSRRVHS